MKVAVIGSGISGLSAAWFLAPHHEVTLFERAAQLGGHAHTAKIKDHAGKIVPVDTGFMVYNPNRYPNLTKLLEHFNVATKKVAMSFSVSIDDGAFEFASTTPDSIFADRANIVRMPFYEFLLEITRFNTVARDAIARGISPHQTLHEFLEEHGFSQDLEEKYLIPLVGSIWSSPKKLARDFPCKALLTFLDSHHLLAVTGRPKWHTIEGGSSVYVERVAEEIRRHGGVIRLNERIRSIRRPKGAVHIRTKRGMEQFDYVVLATHADDALRLLRSPSKEEKVLLRQFTYERNTVYLHSDPSLMPRRKEAWASWNYLGWSGWGRTTKKVTLTYNMNNLQGLETDLPVFVTLNPPRKPKKSLTHARYSYSHPLCTCASMEMRERLASLQDKSRTLFCGSYFGYGFHEDGIASAVEAVQCLGITPPWNDEAP